MPTEFHKDQADFSIRAQEAAKRQFYPNMFPDCKLNFKNVAKTKLDLDYAIDVKLAVYPYPLDLKSWLYVSIQERWRLPKYRHFGDITITEWNLGTNQPSELHKLAAQMFVYGFYEESSDRVVEAWAIDIPKLLFLFSTGKLMGGIGKRRPSNPDQTFRTFMISDLTKLGAVMHHYIADSDRSRDDGAVLFR